MLGGEQGFKKRNRKVKRICRGKQILDRRLIKEGSNQSCGFMWDLINKYSAHLCIIGPGCLHISYADEPPHSIRNLVGEDGLCLAGTVNPFYKIKEFAFHSKLGISWAMVAGLILQKHFLFYCTRNKKKKYFLRVINLHRE